MNLLEIRKWLIKESGRYELVTDNVSYKDNGANKYIQAGQMVLDDMMTTNHSPGSNFQNLAAGGSHVAFTWCRGIKSVWAIDKTTNGKWQLEKKDFYENATYNNSLEYPETDMGPPQYYMPANFRIAPEAEQIGDEVDVPADMLQSMSNSYLYNGLRISPVADVDYIIETQALFYSPQLISDVDENFWSAVYPHLLVLGAQYTMELFSRNTEGAKDWMNSINMILQGINHNMVEQEIADLGQMNG